MRGIAVRLMPGPKSVTEKRTRPSRRTAASTKSVPGFVFRKRERREAEKEEEGLRVDGLEEECGGEEREVEHGAPCACHAEPLLREPLEEHERRERAAVSYLPTVGLAHEDAAAQQIVGDSRRPGQRNDIAAV